MWIVEFGLYLLFGVEWAMGGAAIHVRASVRHMRRVRDAEEPLSVTVVLSSTNSGYSAGERQTMLCHLGRRLVLQEWRGRLCVGKWRGRAPLRASCVLGPGGGRTVSGWHQWLQWSAITR